MPNEARKVLGEGRYCTRCHTKMGTHEECVEVNKHPYHTKCNPERPAVVTNCHIKLPETIVLGYSA